MSDCLTEDIVEQILHRLPLKSIGKCLIVCKSWNLLIKSHNFFQRYSLSNPLFLVYHLHHPWYSLCSRGIEYNTFSLSNKDINHGFVGALNGLVCLCFTQRIYSENIFTFVLLNPLTRRHLQLPISDFSYSDVTYRSRHGFGFDSKNNDFKLVNIFYTDNTFKVYVPPVVELYSLKEGVWRDISASFVEPSFNISDTVLLQFYYNVQKGKPLFFQDSVYWLSLETIMLYSGAFSSTNYILVFNMVEEKFSKMELPEVLARSKRRMDIIVIDGFLSIMEYFGENNGWNIWMKRESWSNIKSVYLPREMINAYPLGLQNTNSEAVLVIPFDDGETVSLHSFDLKSQEMRDLGVKGTFMNLCASDFTYNLNSLDKESYAHTYGECQDGSCKGRDC